MISQIKVTSSMRIPSRLLLTIASCIFIYYTVNTLVKANSSSTSSLEQETTGIFLKNRNYFEFKQKLDTDIEVQPKIQKKVLIYAATSFFNSPIEDSKFLQGCSIKDYCHITSKKEDIDKADAVVFHNADFSSSSFPQVRRNVPYVIWSLESPINDHLRPPQNTINWTMTYRQDADVWFPYGHFEKLDQPIEYDLNSIWELKDKSKTATWLASNCYTQNGRLKVIKKLQTLGLQADLFGKCGIPAPNCNRLDQQGEPCVVTLIKPYKFYLAFENSNCLDYATEKFYESLNSRMAVPIVMKRDIYEKLGAPSSSFIALSDFQSLEEMVAHINNIKDDKEKYLRYHEWRRTHKVLPERSDSTGFCGLCKRLSKPVTTSKTYENLLEWSNANLCDQSFYEKYM